MTEMGMASAVQFILSLVFFAFFLVPMAKILTKAGYSGWWCLIGLLPLVNILMLWIFAFSEWPNSAPRQS